MATPALRLRGLGKDYGDRIAVGAIDLDVSPGECLGLLGPNGAGKTTTISMACGIITPTRGTVEIAGIDLARDPYGAKAKLGVVPQELALYDELPARANLRYFGGLYGLRGKNLATQIERALEIAGLSDRAREPVRQFSGGMKRRLNLVAGLLHHPDVLVLDEPSVGVDPQSRHHIFETVRGLRAGGTTIIYTSHYLEEVEALCDRVAIMDQGRLIATGTIRELVSHCAGDRIVIVLAGPQNTIEAAATAAAALGDLDRDGTTLRLRWTGPLAPVIAAIEGTGAEIQRVDARPASLEAAFLTLTGHALRDTH
ncbi:MAG: ABC transporter ATP-binding protein [Kofleriaceae bacterium]|nr:ABC transporter ATP-binding protein [Kofleriaceae bacterium]